MVVSSVVRSVIVPSVRYIVGQDGLLSQAIDALGGVTPYHYWDFPTNRARFNGQDVGAVTSTPGWSFARATVGTADDLAGNIVQFASGEIRRTDSGILVEDARTNLFLNSAVGATQSVTVAAAAHTLSFRGTGTITLTGTSTAGPLVGSGANTRVTLTFTPTAGSLTLTVSGSCTNVQLEAGAFVSSWIPTAGASVTRNADVLSVTGLSGLTTAGALFMEFTPGTVALGYGSIAQLGDGTSNNRVDMGIITNDGYVYIASGNVVQAEFTNAVSGHLNAYVAGTTSKEAVRWTTNDFRAALGGALVGSADVSGSVPVTLDRLMIGNDHLSRPPFGYIRRAAIFNTALTDAQLQAVTS